MPGGGNCCAVAICKNIFSKTKNNAETRHITYHRFPQSEELRKIWVQRCKRAGNGNLNHSRICSIHFTAEDYERNLQAELLNLTPTRKVLKKTAVPSLCLGPPPSIEKVAALAARSARQKRRANQQIVQELLRNDGNTTVLKKTAVPSPSIEKVAQRKEDLNDLGDGGLPSLRVESEPTPVHLVKNSASIASNERVNFSENTKNSTDKCRCTCLCKKCKPGIELEKKLQATRQKLDFTNKVVKRLENIIKNFTARKPITLKQIKTQLKQHMNELTYEFLLGQLKFNKEYKTGHRWHPAIKELAIAVYRGHPNAYWMMSEIFDMPSKTIILQYETQLKDLMHVEREMLHGSALFDESSFFSNQNAKGTTVDDDNNKENKNHLALANSKEPPAKRIKTVEKFDSGYINVNPINIQPIVETHYIEEPDENCEKLQASTMYIQDGQGNLHPIEGFNSVVHSEFIIVENENSSSVMEAAQNGAAMFFQDSVGNLHPIDGTSSASQSMFVEELIGVDGSVPVEKSQKPEQTTQCNDSAVSVKEDSGKAATESAKLLPNQKPNQTSLSALQEIDKTENERLLRVLLTAAKVVTGKDTKTS